MVGFDTGPGMSLIDECSKLYWNKSQDYNGMYSSKGKIDIQLLSDLMNHKYISKLPPKSTGRDEFGKVQLDSIVEENSHINKYNLIRTLVAFTAKSIAFNMQEFLNSTMIESRLLISGGGVHHPILFSDIQEYTNIPVVESMLSVGVDPDSKEALLMAVLGVAKINSIPSNMKRVTGANSDVILGSVYSLKKEN